MLLGLLREETRSYHQRLERSPLSRLLVSAELSHRLYAAILGVHYGFYAPIEAHLPGIADWRSLEFDLEARMKTRLLLADLSCYGLEGALLRALPFCTGMPRLPDVPAAIGCLYVLEGATLGGRIIARQLAASLGIGPDSGAAFFNSYGSHIDAHWRAFQTFAEHHGAGHEDAVIAAASATFAALESWYADSYRAISGARQPEQANVLTY